MNFDDPDLLDVTLRNLSGYLIRIGYEDTARAVTIAADKVKALSPEATPPDKGLLLAARELIDAFAEADYTVTRSQNNAIGKLAGHVLLAERSQPQKERP